MPSMALAAVPLVAVALAGVYGYSICGPCAGSAARDAFGLHAAPISCRRLTIAASSRPCRLGGQLSRKFVQRGSSTLRCWSTTAETLIRLPMLGAQNQSLPPLALIFCSWLPGYVLPAG